MKVHGLYCYLNSIVSKKGFSISLSSQVQHRRFAPAFCSPHQQSVSPFFTVWVALSEDICSRNTYMRSLAPSLLFWLLHEVVVTLSTHRGQTAHTWPPSCSVQIQLQIPVLPSLSESYNLPALLQLPRGPGGCKKKKPKNKKIWLQEIPQRRGSLF